MAATVSFPVVNMEKLDTEEKATAMEVIRDACENSKANSKAVLCSLHLSLIRALKIVRLHMDDGDGQYPTLTKLGLGAVTFNSALAIYNSWGDATSVAFVLAADAALLLLFICLRAFERGGSGGGGRDAKVKAAAWALTTLLTATFASRVAPLMPLAVGVLAFICLRDVDHVRAGEGGGGINMDRQYCALGKVGLAVLTCNGALDAYDARRDPGSAAHVFVSYILLVILTGLFVRAFARAHDGENGKGQGEGRHF